MALKGLRTLIVRLFFIFSFMVWSIAVTAAPIQQYKSVDRRTWSPISDAPVSAWRIAQSSDGLLWFASPGGLYRFDGEKFQRVEVVYGHKLRSNNVASVTAIGQGVVVTYQFGGLSIFYPDHVEHYDTQDGLPGGNIGGVVVTRDGSLHIGTSIGIAVLNNGKWVPGENNGLPHGRVSELSVDRDGVLWALINDQLYARAIGMQKFVFILNLSPLRTLELIAGRVHGFTSDGKIVRITYGKKLAVVLRGVLPAKDSVFEGPQGALWAWLSKRGGLVRLRSQQHENYAVDRLFDRSESEKNFVVSSFLDREGNVWLGTQQGVERLREQRVQSMAAPEGVFTPYVHLGLGDTVLVSGDTSPEISRMNGAILEKAYEIPSAQAMWRENSDNLWVGSPAGIFKINAHGVKKIRLPLVMKPWQTIQSITLDKQGKVWVSVVGNGLYCLDNGRWSYVDTSRFGDYAVPIIMHTTASGRVIFGFTKNRLGELIDGEVRIVQTDNSSRIGNILSILEVGERLIVGGDSGVVWINKNGNRLLIPEKNQEFRGVSGLAVDRRGDLWLHSMDGIFHVSKEELDNFWKNPGHQIGWDIFNITDGLKGSPAQIRPLPSLTVSPDGKIFYATQGQFGWIDPLTLQRNKRVPDVLILNLRASGREIQPRQGMVLEAGTTEIEFRYAVTAMSIPEKVKIKYRLSGIDQDWREPSGERVARYTNLPSGHYVFQVIAANEDGVWNMNGASFMFDIEPMFWQTVWFKSLLIVLIACILIFLHRWRVSIIAARSEERAATRLDERARIARTLHDDLLQGVHALVIRSGTILGKLSIGSQEERMLSEVVKQAELLIEKTRNQVMDLRAEASIDQLFEQLSMEIQMVDPGIFERLTISLSNEIRLVSIGIISEICLVLKEAILNSIKHSAAKKITVLLYVVDSTLVGEVSDDGVGMAQDIADRGLLGHWGIEGMRERMERLGGKLNIESTSRGTIVKMFLKI